MYWLLPLESLYHCSHFTFVAVYLTSVVQCLQNRKRMTSLKSFLFAVFVAATTFLWHTAAQRPLRRSRITPMANEQRGVARMGLRFELPKRLLTVSEDDNGPRMSESGFSLLSSFALDRTMATMDAEKEERAEKEAPKAADESSVPATTATPSRLARKAWKGRMLVVR